jgi:hypothetical protein
MPMVTRKRMDVLEMASWLLLVVFTLTACAETSATTTSRSSDSTTTTATPTTSDGTGVPEMVVSPEFINGAIPDSRLVLLVGLADSDQGPVTITAEAETAEVAVDPPTIDGTEIAEVTVVPGPTEIDTTIDVTVTATSGDQTSSIVRTVDIVPWEDDREDQAREILGLFVEWLADARPEFGITSDTSFSGTLTAPLLLIVSHYAFFTDEWEVGVSWHIMIPPDDFAEMYLRPRTAMQPTYAFRIDSWQTALETGTYAVSEVAPPAEVVR